jgi:hypothetical protein
MISTTEFHWNSSLGISVILFLLYGLIYIVIGSLEPFMSQTSIGKTMIVISPRTDEKLFGDKPEKILAENNLMANLRKIIFNMLAAMLLVSGILIISIAWFGLKTGNIWALIVLSVAGIIVLPFWWLVFKPYFDAGIKITITDLPPFIWLPALLYLPAIILGWKGLKL